MDNGVAAQFASTRDKVTTDGQSSYVDPNVGRIVKIGTVETPLDGDDETLSRCLTAAKIDYVVGNVGQHFTYHSRELKSVMLWKAKEYTERQNEIVASITSNMDDCVNYARQTEIALGDSNMEEAVHSFQMIQACERRDAGLRGELDRLRSSSNSGDVRRLCSMSEVHAAVNAFNARVNTMFNRSPSETELDESQDGETGNDDDNNKDENNDGDKPSEDGTSVRTGAAHKGHPVVPARLEETEEQTRERLHNTTVAYLTKQPLPVMSSSNAGASSSSQPQPVRDDANADSSSDSESDEDGDMPSGLGAIVSAVESDAFVASSKANVLGAVSLISDRVERLRREQNARSERDKYRYELEADLEERLEALATGTLSLDELNFFSADPDAPEEAFLFRDASICLHSATKSILSQPGLTTASASVQPDGPPETLICRLYFNDGSQTDSSSAEQSCANAKSGSQAEVPKEYKKAAGSAAVDSSGTKRYAMLMLHPGAKGYFEFMYDCAGKSLKVVDGRKPQLACIGRPLAIQQFTFEFDESLTKDDCVVVSVEELVNADHSKSIVVRRLKRVPSSGIGVARRQAATQTQTTASNSESTQQQQNDQQVPTQYVQVSTHRLNGIVQHFERMRYFQVDEFTVMLCALNRRAPSALVYNYDFVTGSLIATHVLRSGIVDLTYETDTGLLVACCADRVLRFLTCTGVLLKEVDAAWLMNLYPSCFTKPYHTPFSASYAPVQAVCTDDLIYVLYEYSPRPGQSTDQQPSKVEQRRMLLFRGDTSFSCELVISSDALVANQRVEKIATIQRLRLAVVTSSPPTLHTIRLVASPAELICFRLYDCFERDHSE